MRIPSRNLFRGLRNRTIGNTRGIRTNVSGLGSSNRQRSLQMQLANLSNSINSRLRADSTLGQFNQQQNQIEASLSDAMQEYRANVLQFLSTAPPAIQQILGSEQMMSTIMNSYYQQRPEARQLQSIAQQREEYVSQNYGAEQERMKQIQERISNLGAGSQVNLTVDQIPINAVRQPPQEPIVDPLRPTMDRPPVNIPVDPDISPTQEGVYESSLGYKPGEGPVEPDGPLFFTKAAPDPRFYGPIVDPEIPFKPIEREPIKPIVDPIRQPLITKPAVQEPTLNLPIVDPAKPAPQGLAAKPSTRKSRFKQSMFSGINTNVRG